MKEWNIQLENGPGYPGSGLIIDHPKDEQKFRSEGRERRFRFSAGSVQG